MRINKRPANSSSSQNKRTIFFGIALAVLSLILSLDSANADNQIRWRDVNSGLQEGKQSHKFILADVYTDWCGWCKRLDRDTFSNADLTRFLENKFVCVKANAEDNGQGEKMAHDYGVNGYPCALVFSQEGKLIGRIVGYKDAQGYQNALSNIISNPTK